MRRSAPYAAQHLVTYNKTNWILRWFNITGAQRMAPMFIQCSTSVKLILRYTTALL